MAKNTRKATMVVRYQSRVFTFPIAKGFHILYKKGQFLRIANLGVLEVRRVTKNTLQCKMTYAALGWRAAKIKSGELKGLVDFNV